MQQYTNLNKIMERETIKKKQTNQKILRLGLFFKMFSLLSFLISAFIFTRCKTDNNNDTGEEYLTCDKIHSTASTFTTLNVSIGSTYADNSGYSKITLWTNNLVNDTTRKSFVVAESEKNSKSQTFILKDVPNEYLGNLVYDVYSGGRKIVYPSNPLDTIYEPFKKVEGYKSFQLYPMELSNSELQNLHFSNKNTKIAIIYECAISIKAKAKMGTDDGDDALGFYTVAEIDLDNTKIECSFQYGNSNFVYSDSDCDIVGKINTVNIDIHLRKGWNKVFDFNGTIITSDLKDSYFIWYQHAG